MMLEWAEMKKIIAALLTLPMAGLTADDNPAAKFEMQSFDHVRGPETFPLRRRETIKRQQLLARFLHAGHDALTAPLPAADKSQIRRPRLPTPRKT